MDHSHVFRTIGRHYQRITAVDRETLYFIRYEGTNAYLRHVRGYEYITQRGPDGAALFYVHNAQIIVKVCNHNNGDAWEMVRLDAVVEKGYTIDLSYEAL